MNHVIADGPTIPPLAASACIPLMLPHIDIAARLRPGVRIELLEQDSSYYGLATVQIKLKAVNLRLTKRLTKYFENANFNATFSTFFFPTKDISCSNTLKLQLLRF